MVAVQYQVPQTDGNVCEAHDAPRERVGGVCGHADTLDAVGYVHVSSAPVDPLPHPHKHQQHHIHAQRPGDQLTGRVPQLRLKIVAMAGVAHDCSACMPERDSVRREPRTANILT